MNYNIPCPICSETMQPTDSHLMVACKKQELFVSELKSRVETVHALYYLNADGTPMIKTIEVLPFIFEIINEPHLKQTRIMKLKLLNAKRDYTTTIPRLKYGSKSFDRETLIVVQGAVNCQWDNPTNVFDRVKMFMLFS